MNTRKPLWKRLLGGASGLITGFVVAIAFLWAFGAIIFDGPFGRAGNVVVAAVWLILALALPFAAPSGLARAAGRAVCFLVVLIPWLRIRPSAAREWQPDVTQTAWAEIKGDEITLHNVRNCDYRSETDFTPRWDTRTMRLSQLTGIDFAICYWGSPYMAHPIASFQFADSPPVCISIETRKEKGERYSAIGGFYRQFELIYVVADEGDVIRLRTNFREGEDVFLYRLNITPEKARDRFMDYIAALNKLHDQPRWYNAATTNCTTAIRAQRDASKRAPWDWRMLANGKGDEMMFERGAFATDGLPFADLKGRARINDDARSEDGGTDFSRRIRANRPGMPKTPPAR